ncbi:MAG: HD domain-containing protein [Bacillota bacterium]|nr:HD domain-containing protein [Bacillota bacterium]
MKNNRILTAHTGHINRMNLKAVKDFFLPILLVNSKNQILYANSAAITFYGYEKSELLKMNINHLNKNANASGITEPTLINLGRRLEYNALHYTKQGLPVEVHVNIFSIEYYGFNMFYFIAPVSMYNTDLGRNDFFKDAFKKMLDLILEITQNRDPYTYSHQKRVANLSYEIGNQLGLSKNEKVGLYLAGILHDVGKLGIPISILLKPGKLDKEEYDIIKTHCEIGAEYLKDFRIPWPIHKYVLQHHERLNGSGYPYGLTGKEIEFESKIIAVSDVAEAMLSNRSYRSALDMDVVLGELSQAKNTLFDAEIVDVCIRIIKDGTFKWEKLLHDEIIEIIS